MTTLLYRLRTISIGIPITPNIFRKCGGHVDDISMMANNEEDFKNQLTEVRTFEKASTSKLSMPKSKLLIRFILKRIKIYGITIATKNETIKYLGYMFNAYKDIDNVELRLEKIIKELENWKKTIYLTLIGKFTILNVYILSQIYYFMYCTKINNQTLTKINNIIKWFLFDKENQFKNRKIRTFNIRNERLYDSYNKIQIVILDPKFQWQSLQASLYIRYIKNRNDEGDFIKVFQEKTEQINKANRLDDPFYTVNEEVKKTKFKKTLIQQICSQMIGLHIQIENKCKIGDRSGFINNQYRIVKIIMNEKIITENGTQS